MATSSRQSALFGVNDWKAIYQTFKQADFKSYDYETLRKSFIDYLRAYYPETFNDYVESSEITRWMETSKLNVSVKKLKMDLDRHCKKQGLGEGIVCGKKHIPGKQSLRVWLRVKYL